MLGRGVRERAELLEEAGLHILLGEPVEQLLHRPAVTRPGGPHADGATVSQLDVALLPGRVRAPAPQLPASPDETSDDGGLEQ
jgi:hypothetical protein